MGWRSRNTHSFTNTKNTHKDTHTHTYIHTHTQTQTHTHTHTHTKEQSFFRCLEKCTRWTSAKLRQGDQGVFGSISRTL